MIDSRFAGVICTKAAFSQSSHRERQRTPTTPQSRAWSGQFGSRCMVVNTRSRRYIDYTSGVGCSGVFFQERGQAENNEYQDGR